NNGFIYNVDLNVIKENMRILNNTILDIDPDNIYNPDSRVNIMKDNENLSVSVPELNKKFIYFSYGIQNNSFNKIPEKSLVDLNTKNLYKITAPFQLHDEVDFTPTIIEYNNSGKTNLI